MSWLSVLGNKLGIPTTHITIGSVEKSVSVQSVIGDIKNDVESWVKTGAADLTGPQGDALIADVLSDVKSVPVLSTVTPEQVEALVAVIVPKYETLLLDKIDSVFDLATEAETTPPPSTTVDGAPTTA